MKKFFTALFCAAIIITIMVMIIGEVKNTKADTNQQAPAYNIIDQHDYSFQGRKRIRWMIYSEDANTIEDRKTLFEYVAKKCIKETNADQCHIFIDVLPLPQSAGKGESVAIGAYTPDGKGNSGKDNSPIWELEVSDHVFTPQEKDIIAYWYVGREHYRKKSDGLVDEPALKKFIAKELNISIEEVTLPWIKRSPIKVL